eukprot:scaffold2922_cov125-Isochrysis_galbana.AAC.1
MHRHRQTADNRRTIVASARAHPRSTPRSLDSSFDKSAARSWLRSSSHCRIRGAANYSPITVTDVQSDGRPRAVPRDSHGALPLRDAVAAARLYGGLSGAAAVDRRIDNNLSYLDGLVIANLHYNDADFRRGTWGVYHNLHMCRLGVCPNWLWYTLLSPGRLAWPPFPPPPLTVSPGARPIISGMHGCGGWLGLVLVLYIGPGWGYGGGPRRGVGRCGLPFYQREGRSALVRAGPLYLLV